MKYLYLLIFILLPSLSAFSQDERQRTVETIVMDVLAQLPADTPDKQEQEMKDLAEAGEKAVEILGSMLKEPEKGRNSNVEYAISGLVSYTTDQQHSRFLPAVRKGLGTAIRNCTFATGKAFLMSQLQLCSTIDQADVFLDYITDPQLASPALNGLIQTPGTEIILSELIKAEKADKLLLAYAAKEKCLSEMEPILLSWLEKETKKETKDMICSALASCGSKASLKALQKASTSDYINLLLRLSQNSPDKKIVSKAQKMLSGQPANIRIAATQIILSSRETDINKLFDRIIKDADGQYRNAALKMFTPYMTEEIYAKIPQKYRSLSDEAKVDLLIWLGNNKINSLVPLLIQAAKEGSEITKAAIAAAGKLDASQAGDFLVSQLSGAYATDAVNAILSYKGNLTEKLIKLLETDNDQAKEKVLYIISQRRIKEASKNVFELLSSSNKDIVQAAYKALEGVVTSSDFSRISRLLEVAQGNEIILLQSALKSSLSLFTPTERYNNLLQLLHNSSNPYVYYPVLASTGIDMAAKTLIDEYEKGINSKQALQEILKMDNQCVTDFLHKLIETDSGNETIILRYIDLVQKSRKKNNEKTMEFKELLRLKPTKAITQKILIALSTIPSTDAFSIASDYLSDKEFAYTAANTIKQIVSNKTSAIDFKIVQPALEKVIHIYSSTGNADDKYAIDEIKKLIEELKPIEPFILPEEERQLGYEILFDGTNLSKWMGDTIGYKSVNGAIYVTADYGYSKNLYTKKEYKDFIFKFEFCFKKPGINNGVGIRTPMHVDAAYGAMCEVQILDHDDPAYSKIAEYQVHGSAYGIIPAKRIKHKPLGEWSQQEIKVIGDHITVTLNGEIILDGNLREACQGHNVSPDGSKQNPYTADHKNHPGMFNEKGYISFCGHGAGIMFRNIRVLDLTNKKGGNRK